MQPFRLPAISFPAVGAAAAGVKFAGILTDKTGQPYALLLLDERAPPAAWDKQMAWAQALQADLPTRSESALLFALLPDEFEKRWHWTNETTSWNPRAAWHQHFYYGYQSYYAKGAELPARAVRRFPLQSLGPLSAAPSKPAKACAAGPANSTCVPADGC